MDHASKVSPRVSLIVVNYNTADLVRRLLQTCEGGADEVVVVDNGSTVGDLRGLSTDESHVRVLSLHENLGYGAGANRGAQQCTGDIFVVANPDVLISGEDLRRLAAEAASPGVGIAAPRFLDADGQLLPSSHYRDPGLLTTMWAFSRHFGGFCRRVRPNWNPSLRPLAEHLVDHDSVHVLGALMAIDADVFRRIGGFDERFFLYREETDLCDRVRRIGLRVRHCADIRAMHDGDASSPDLDIPVNVRQESVRSHYLYLRKHRGPIVTAVAWLLGLGGSVLWAMIGPYRSWGRSSLRAHLRTGPSQWRGAPATRDALLQRDQSNRSPSESKSG